jgi:MFS family permease
MSAGLVSLLQQAAPDGQRGSVFAAVGLGEALGQAVGLLTGGALQGVVGTLPLMEVQAGCYAAAALLALVLLPRTSRPARPGRGEVRIQAEERSWTDAPALGPARLGGG